jgi:pimeloyl-ACP methyl ester carboxylesterase
MRKPSLLLLHGALGSAGIFKRLIPLLESHFDIFAPDLRWHGSRATADAQFVMEDLVADLEALLQKHGQAPYAVFGFSMGGYVAMALAMKQPQYFSKIATLGTKLAWNEAQAAHESKMLNPDKIAEKVPAFAQYLESQQGANWQALCRQTAYMMQQLGANPLLSTDKAQQINLPIHIALGDADNMVSREESEAFVAALPQAQIELLPNTPHPFEKVDINLLANRIMEWFK